MFLLWRHLKRCRRFLYGALGLAAINQIFSLLDPQIFRLIIDRYASRASQLAPGVFLRGVTLLLLAAVGAALVSRVAKNFQDYCVNVVTQRVGTALYAQGVQHALSLPFAVFEDQRSGELLQKLQKARQDAVNVMTGAVNVVFLSMVGVLFVLGYAFTVHWQVGLVYTLVIPTLGVTTFAVSRRIKSAQQRIVTESAALAGSTTETLRNVELVKSLGLERQEVHRLNTVNDRILALELKKIRLVRVLSFFQGTMINAVRSLLLLLLLWLIARQQITLGEFFSLYIYSFFVFNPLYELSVVAAQFHEARASLETLQGILDLTPEPRPTSPRRLGPVRTIAFENVSFRYASAAQPSVHGISLTIESGQTIAFVGPSGSGKSTLVKLLVGLYLPTDGELRFNDGSIAALNLQELRDRIGFVAQETQLFAGSLRENLLFGKPQATDAECLAVLRQAAAIGIVERGDRGLATTIGEGGMKLSGGERQRLAIARALLRQPELLIFDEATSSLDSLTERAITQTIQGIAGARPNLITVIVAHRLSTVAQANPIYVLERGHIIEHGSHAELLAAGGLYAALWREQSARQP